MDSHPLPPPDDVDELLRPRPAAGNDPLRQVLLARTTAALRRRRRLRRLGLAAALAACYLAGMLTVRLGMSPASTDRPAAAVAKADRPAKKEAPPVRPAPRQREAPAEAAPSALALEWQALDSDDRRFELYRRAGDRYLEESNDVESALRCYRGAYAAASEKERAVSVHDNWLLMAVKQERLKEKRDAQNGG